MNRMRAIIILPILAVTAAIGFGAGRWAGRGSLFSMPSPGATAGTSLSSGGSTASHAKLEPGELPAADFTDRAGLNAYVGKLKALGLTEELANWVAISAKAREDLPGSLALAKARHATREWGAVVALTDPEGGFALLSALHDSGDRLGMPGQMGAVGSFFQTLGGTNPALGLKLLGQLPAWTGRKAAEALIGRWAASDPGGAMEAAMKLSPPWVQEGALIGLCHEWGDRDRRGMIAWASDQGTKIARIAFNSQFDMSGRVDPTELMDIAAEFPKAVDPMTLYNVVGELANRGAKSFDAIANFPAGRFRDGMIWTYSMRLAETDPEAAWKLADSLPAEDKKKFLNWSVERSLAKVEPEKIAEYMLTTTDMSEISDLSEIVSVWAHQDPSAALQWSSLNLQGSRRADSMEAALRQWALKDPSAAVSAADELPAGMRAKLMPGLYSAWAGKAPEAALVSAGDLPTIDRTRATESVIRGWAFSDPIAAAKALATLPPGGLDGAYAEISYRFADKDPDAALKWASSIPNTDLAGRMAGNITRQWGQNDAATVSSRLDALPAGDFRDRAVSGFIGSISNLDPESAATWATSIGQEKLRTESVRKVVESWRSKDRNAARAFVNGMQAGPLKDQMLGVVNK
jgi:hypothetical protein